MSPDDAVAEVGHSWRVKYPRELPGFEAVEQHSPEPSITGVVAVHRGADDGNRTRVFQFRE